MSERIVGMKNVPMEDSSCIRREWERMVAEVIIKGRDSRDKKNVVFMVGGKGQLKKQFILSRSLLRLSSNAFDKIVGKSQPYSNRVKIYKIEDVSIEDFDYMVQYMFMQSNWKFTNIEQACSLIESCDTYGLVEFKNEVLDQLSALVISEGLDAFDDMTVCDDLEFLRKLDCSEGVNLAVQYILKNFMNVVEQENFYDLSPDTMEEILASDDLEVQSELDAFKALLWWGSHKMRDETKLFSVKSLQSIIAPLIPLIRFPIMPERVFRNWVLQLDILTKEQSEWIVSNWSRAEEDLTNMMFSSQPRHKYLQDIFEDETHGLKTLADCREELESMKAKLFHSHFLSSLLSDDIDKLDSQMKTEVTRLEAELSKTKVESSKKLSKVQEELVQVQQKLEQLELMDFSYTGRWACKVVLQNKSSSTLRDPLKWFEQPTTREFYHMPKGIAKKSAQIFGFDYLGLSGFKELVLTFLGEVHFRGLFSYRIGETRLVARYFIQDWHNDFAIAFVPASVPLNVHLFDQLYPHIDWSGSPNKKKATVWYNGILMTEIKAAVELNNLRAEATMTTGPKSLFTIVLSNI